MKSTTTAVTLRAGLGLGLGLACGLAWLAGTTAHAQTPPAPAAPAAGAQSALVQQGAYLAKAADCIACHSVPGGQPFAGGFKMLTPIGAIYSSNITPDPETGIGKYSYADFDKAVRHGVRPDGATLYPAMPYPSYARVSDADTKAMYAYFMQGVKPVRQANKPVDIPWPLSMRFPLAFWRMAFAPAVAGPAVAPGADQVLARGAYLAETLGHCGACHTPRAISMQEKAMNNGDPLFLSGGGTIDGWDAASLRGDQRDGLGNWSVDDIVTFLRNGRNNHTAAFGGMSDVVVNSTQHWTDGDLNALAQYLKSLAPSHPDGAAKVVYDDTVTKALRVGDISRPGAQIYVNRCAACHHSDGAGYTRFFPKLAGNPIVQTQDATSLMHLVLSGDTVMPTKKSPTAITMPGFASSMTDQDVADVVNFVRNSWGNQAPPVTVADVARERKQPYNQLPKRQSDVKP